MSELILIDPPVGQATRFGKLEKAGSFLPSLGLCYLASSVRRQNLTVKIIDANVGNYSISSLIKAVLVEQPKFVGISATTLTINTVGKIATALKKKSSKLLVIVGGAHMTAVPRQTMKVCKDIDIGVIGEGEESLSELLEAVKIGKSLKGVPGLIIRNKRKLIRTSPRPFIKNLDKLPLPAWDLLPGFPQIYRPSVNSYRHLPAAHLFTSRGCTGKCIFCDRSVFGRMPRMVSSNRVLEMIGYLIKNYGVHEVQFFDDNFCLFPKRLEEICLGLIKKKLGISWSCQARADMINKRTLKLMKRAGCWQIGLGVESGSDKILKTSCKGETKEVIKKAVELIHQAGIEVKGFFILGNPGETKRTLTETKDFILSLPFTYVHTTYFTPYPGSAAYRFASRFGLFKNRYNWERLGQGTIAPLFIPKGLTKNYLQETAAEIFKRFYFRPKMIFYSLRKAVFLPQLWPAYLRGFLSVFSFANR